jgi:predicted subunit of tRNA(5-methylaminomethyl-2-thiouridylate) methyltransferase
MEKPEYLVLGREWLKYRYERLVDDDWSHDEAIKYIEKYVVEDVLQDLNTFADEMEAENGKRE